MKDRTRSARRLEVLRGMAIAGVVAVHTSAHFKYVEGLLPVVAANIAVDVVAHFAVPLLMLLSGLALTLRYGAGGTAFNAKTFYARRLGKIVPPYVVFSLLYLLLFTVQYRPPEPTWVPLALLTGSGYYHLWFVALLIQLYLVFPLLRRVIGWAAERGAIGALFVAALALQMAWNVGAPLLRDALPARPLFETLLSERFALSHLFYFVLGMAAGTDLAGFERRIVRLPPLLPVVGVAALGGMTAWTWAAAVAAYGSLGAAPAASFLLAAAVEPALHLATIALLWRAALGLGQGGRGAAAGLARLGALSLPIYLVHVAWQWALAQAMAAAGVTPKQWTFYLAMFAGTLALSAGSAWVFARMPWGEALTGARR